jgi:hypothetical protein
MTLLLEKPTVCKDCQSRSISRKKRPFWLKLLTSNKRLHRCDICGWTVWVHRTAASSATPDALAEFPETVLQSSRHEDTRSLVVEPPAPPTVEPIIPAGSNQASKQQPPIPSAQRHGQGDLSFDSE